MKLHDETRDGVRIFAVDSGRETLRATLFFRVGQADETLATSGWTHLIEHSALHDWDDPRLAFNASVGLFTTRFDLDGETDAVLEHLTRLTTWLAEPDLSRLDHEAKVLRAESEQRPFSAAALNFDWRFGARGPGLTHYRELGLGRAEPHAIREWAARMFCADNAVLAVDSPLPDSFSLPLVRGERRPAVLPDVAAIALPGGYRGPGGLVGSGTVARGFASPLAAEVLSRSMTETFRHEQGAAYAPWANIERVNADASLIFAGTDLSGDGAAGAGSAFIQMLWRLGQDGPPDRMLDDMRTMRMRQMRDPQAAPGVAWAAAVAVLSDSDVLTYEEAAEGLDAVTATEIAQVIGQYHRSLVLGLPEESRWPEGLHELGPRTWAPLESGQSFAHWDGETTLRVNDAAVQIANGRRSVTVPLTDVAALMTFPDGARHLISGEGWSITVEPNLYRRGERLVEHLDAAVPSDKLLPQPARQADSIPQRPPLWKTSLARVGRWMPDLPWWQVALIVWIVLQVGRALT